MITEAEFEARGPLAKLLGEIRQQTMVIGKPPAHISTQIVADNIAMIGVTNEFNIRNVVTLTMPEEPGGICNLIWAGGGDANVSIDIVLPYWLENDEHQATASAISWALRLMFPQYLTGGDTVVLTPKETEVLKEKLGHLMQEADGVDIWLAPGGTLDVAGADGNAECFLDYDEEAWLVLNQLYNRLPPQEEIVNAEDIITDDDNIH